MAFDISSLIGSFFGGSSGVPLGDLTSILNGVKINGQPIGEVDFSTWIQQKDPGDQSQSSRAPVKYMDVMNQYAKLATPNGPNNFTFDFNGSMVPVGSSNLTSQPTTQLSSNQSPPTTQQASPRRYGADYNTHRLTQLK